MSRRSKVDRRREYERNSIYRDLPSMARKLRTKEFGAWLFEQGCVPVETKSEYEVARWLRPAPAPVNNSPCGIIYRNRAGQITWTLDSAEDYRAFLKARNTPALRALETSAKKG